MTANECPGCGAQGRNLLPYSGDVCDHCWVFACGTTSMCPDHGPVNGATRHHPKCLAELRTERDELRAALTCAANHLRHMATCTGYVTAEVEGYGEMPVGPCQGCDPAWLNDYANHLDSLTTKENTDD